MFASKEEVDKILEDTINQIHAASPVTPGRPLDIQVKAH